MPRLVLKTDGAQAEGIELRPGRNRLGRGPDNDFLIEHPTVSTAHCEVVCEDAGIRVRDCDSTNGTFINKVRIREAFLKPGSIVSVGQSQLRFNAREEEVEIIPSRSDRCAGLIGCAVWGAACVDSWASVFTSRKEPVKPCM